MHLGASLRDLCERQACTSRQLLCLACRRDAEARLLEQLHSDQTFELARCPMHARLRHVLGPRGEAEVAVLDDRAERVQMCRAHQPGRVEIEVAGASQLRNRVPQMAYGALDAARAQLAGRRQRNTGVAAREQRSAEVALHPGNGLRYGGLRDVHRPGCGTDTAEARNLAKCMEMPEIDRRHDSDATPPIAVPYTPDAFLISCAAPAGTQYCRLLVEGERGCLSSCATCLASSVGWRLPLPKSVSRPSTRRRTALVCWRRTCGRSLPARVSQVLPSRSASRPATTG